MNKKIFNWIILFLGLSSVSPYTCTAQDQPRFLFQLSVHNHFQHLIYINRSQIVDKNGHSLLPYSGAITLQSAYKFTNRVNSLRIKTGTGYHYLTGEAELAIDYSAGKSELGPATILGYNRHHDLFLMTGISKPFSLRNSNLFFAYSFEIHFRISKNNYYLFGEDYGIRRLFHNLEFGLSIPKKVWLESITMGYKTHPRLKYRSIGINTTINLLK